MQIGEDRSLWHTYCGGKKWRDSSHSSWTGECNQEAVKKYQHLSRRLKELNIILATFQCVFFKIY